ncbi:hypothetical protein HPP92_018925 [Vanilla planifolia]|nr:hypothetical protein HPP92_018925 [Vanilla planifolia]
MSLHLVLLLSDPDPILFSVALQVCTNSFHLINRSVFCKQQFSATPFPLWQEFTGKKWKTNFTRDINFSEILEEHTKPTPVAVPPPPSVATHTRTIGIIHPPPDIRTIIDKTANFVAKNGPDFERRIIANNAGNAKFNFLLQSDPYHAYYQHKVSDFRIQNQTSQQPSDDTAQPGESTSMISSAAAPQQLSVEDAPGTRTEDPSAQFRIPPRKVLEPPEAEQYTVRLPEGITGEELDIIKLTAQFVARNGKSF